MRKSLHYHDSGLKWIFDFADNGVIASVESNGFRKEPGFFPENGILDFDRCFNAYLQAEPEQYEFRRGYILEGKRIHYDFSHEDINRMLTIPEKPNNPLIQAFLSEVKEFRAQHFSCGTYVNTI